MLLILTSCSSIPKETGNLKIYFCPKDNCEEIIIKEIIGSHEIKCAFYDLNLLNLTKVLEYRNAEVLVFEKNYKNFGIKVKSKGLMHNKFCVMDKKALFTGSFNPTLNGNKKNNNNLVYIESETLAKNYLEEFEEIRRRESKRTKNTKVIFNDFLIENYFCPEDECQEKVLKELMKAKQSIHFMTFSFTDKEIAETLIEKSKEITVQGIMERKRIGMKYNVFRYLNESKVKVWLDNNPYTMHHKVFIIDEKTVITGSYNPTKNGNENNDENMLIIHNKDIAKKYVEEYNRIKSD